MTRPRVAAYRILAAAIVAGLLAGACSPPRQLVGTRGDVDVTGSVNRLSDRQLAGAVDSWGQRYAADPKNKQTLLNYASALRLAGRTEQSVAVLRKGVVNHPNDRDVSAAFGKALAANGEFDQALRVIRDAQTDDRPDWRLLSAEGAILDQVGQTREARDRYARALQIVPGEPSVLNNYALSHVLTGDLGQAEKLLRQAAQAPNAESRVRQNLALVLGLQGRFQEAETIATSELDPDQAVANMAYLKSMMSQTNTWKQIKSDDGKKSG